MKVSAEYSSLSSIKSELVAVFVFQDEKLFTETMSGISSELSFSFKDSATNKDFSGKENESLLLYTEKKNSSRLLFMGLGECDKFSVEKLRRVSASAAKKAFC